MVPLSKPFLGAKVRVAAACSSPAAGSAPRLAPGAETREAVPPAPWGGFFAVLCSFPSSGCRGRRAPTQGLPGLAHLPAPHPAKQQKLLALEAWPGPAPVWSAPSAFPHWQEGLLLPPSPQFLCAKQRSWQVRGDRGAQ